MSLLSPTNPVDVKRAGWVFGGLILMPLLAHLAFLDNTYLSSDAWFRAWMVAVALGVPVGVLLVRRMYRLIRLGLHPTYSAKSAPSPFQFYIALPIVMMFLVVLWAHMLVGAFVWFPGRPILERTFVVAEARECKRKCGGCRYKARLRGWPGRDMAQVCTQGIEPRVQGGEPLVVRGRFSSLGVHVESVRRTRRPPPPRAITP